jgi:hypothetical protein
VKKDHLGQSRYAAGIHRKENPPKRGPWGDFFVVGAYLLYRTGAGAGAGPGPGAGAGLGIGAGAGAADPLGPLVVPSTI